MNNCELLLTKQAEENIDETLETLMAAAREIAAASEKDFERIKSKKWYKRLWEIVTFSKDNQKIQARGVSNLAKLNEITMKAIVLVAKQGKDTAAKVCECLNQIKNLEDDVECLYEQQIKITETILTIKRGFETEERFDELSSNQKDIIFAVLRKYSGANFNEYTQRLLTSIRMSAHETYGDVEYSIIENELKPSSQRILFSLIHGFSLLLNDSLADESHELFDYICLSGNIKSKIKDRIQSDINIYGKSGYVRLFESDASDNDALIEEFDIQWNIEIYEDSIGDECDNVGQIKQNIINCFETACNTVLLNSSNIKTVGTIVDDSIIFKGMQIRIEGKVSGGFKKLVFENCIIDGTSEAELFCDTLLNCEINDVKCLSVSNSKSSLFKRCKDINIYDISSEYIDIQNCTFVDCDTLDITDSKICECEFDKFNFLLFHGTTNIINSQFKNVSLNNSGKVIYDEAICLEGGIIDGCCFENIELKDDIYLLTTFGYLFIENCSFENISCNYNPSRVFSSKSEENVFFKSCSGVDQDGVLTDTRSSDISEKNITGYMVIEDCFLIKGRGPVVTGTISRGFFELDDCVMIVKPDKTSYDSTISGIESGGKLYSSATVGEQVGILLSGIDRSQICEGDMLVKK